MVADAGDRLEMSGTGFCWTEFEPLPHPTSAPSAANKTPQ
jgi:hypothetical protein